MKVFALVIGVSIAVLAPPAANATCSYRGQDDARTTISQEFKDSHWVVRAKVLSATEHFTEGQEPWTLYRLQVQHAYKGRPSPVLAFFTFRNSGGFYMDRASSSPRPDHDIGGEYLLFLNPPERLLGMPSSAHGTVVVNYSCGVSGPWSQVSTSSRTELLQLGN